MKTLDNTVGLRTFRLGPAVIDILDRQVELIFVPFRIAAIFRTTIGEHPQQVNLVLVIERYDAVVQQIGRRERCLAIVELDKGDLGIGVDVSLLVNSPDAFQIADIERVLSAAIAWMLALELPERMFIIRDKRS